MKNRLLKIVTLLPLLTFLVVLYIIEYRKRFTLKSYLTFDQILDQNLDQNLSENLLDLIPRFESIFFIETSGATGFELKNLCVIESAAKYHPDNHIYVLVTSPIFHDKNFRNLQLRSIVWNAKIGKNV